MPYQCGVNGCLRATDVEGQPCKSCAIGGKPLLNPKSRHAIAPENVVTKNIVKTGIQVKDPKTGKNIDAAVLAKMNEKACDFLVSVYWYGWDGGFPSPLTTMLKPFGEFKKGSKAKGKMVIDLSDDQNYHFISEIYKNERDYMKLKNTLSSSPVFREKTDKITIEDLAAMVANNGKSFTFKKGNSGVWEYEDENGIVRQVPQWAVS